MTIKPDKAGHLHTNVGNIRITYIPRQSRDKAKDWAGSDVIRINAYKGDPGVSQALHRGAEFPIADAKTLEALVSSLHAIYSAGIAAQTAAKGEKP